MILEILRRSRRPLAAVEVIVEVQRRRPAFQSQVFRELLRMQRDGAIRKIKLARGYAVDGNTRQISLFCRRCEALSVIPCENLFGALDVLAASGGYRPEQYVVELAGTCAVCAGQPNRDG